MKKIWLTIFLLILTLSFSTVSLVKIENTYMDSKGVVYITGEEKPFMGIVENYKFSDGGTVLEGRIPFKNRLWKEPKFFYPSGKLASIATFKSGKIKGMQKDFYENGIKKKEISYKNRLLDGLTKIYYPNGKV